MHEFYITFGQKYRHEPHPRGGHPDGWMTIEAGSVASASKYAFRELGEQWAFIYTKEDFEKSKGLYPKGWLGHITHMGATIFSELENTQRKGT